MAFDSLFIGVSGLESYQSQIDVISNNIANVGTTGFKGQTVTFQDLIYQTQQYESGPTATRGGSNAEQLGLGVKVATVDTNLQQGGLQTTGVNTDLSLNGDGYFILNTLTGNGTPAYTRDGHFQLNANGVLYDPSSGLAVQGFTANSAGVITATNTPSAIQIPLGLKSQAVGTGAGVKLGPSNDKNFDFSVGGNLDQTQYLQAVSNGAATAGNLATISATVYDSLGGSHLVNITFTPTTNAAGGINVATTQVPNSAGQLTTASSEWAVNITSTDGTLFSTAAGATSTSVTSGYAFFDQNGQFINTSGSINGVTAGTNTHTSGTKPSYANGNQIAVAQWGTTAQAQNATTQGTAGTAPPSGPIGLDFSSMTGLVGATTANTLAQNGYAAGILSNITVGTDGTVTGAFSNGQNQTLARVAVATFQNEEGLKRNGANQFVASSNSGIAQIGTAGSGRFGTIVSGSLEQSNVSIADEFTKMILAQRSFEANSRSITTADQDLQTVIGLKR